ncbi:protease modulator HflC [Marinibactrum halimedae]|uniref:Protein HflC n=1 Tax=Marinibactrum halimedae TaxID=1444977 RepID=A0AA37T054_9GAMM|nr:protease modulator HflC [Marinibactrum halimedae]MCD9459719.1 protease modulator HflC [Marinibactrum halimedae]GLS24524.1 protein HflC [Marinibactrum halimedae]
MNGKIIGAVIGVLALIIVANSIYIVKETERAVLLEFGRLSEPNIEPGLHFKIPMVQQVRKFDARVLTFDAPEERFLTLEKKGMMVDSFAKWRIQDVNTYYKATNGDEARAEQLLAQRINEGLRNQFAQRSLLEVVSGERDQLMIDLTNALNEFSNSSLGIEVVDVRVKRIDLPEDVSDSVFRRMTSEREREAREHRAKGREQAEVIQADADRQKAVIEAEAYRDSEYIRGEGDAQAAAIYASAYNKDREFYSFLRSLQAYKQTFSGRGDLLLVDPESEFFRYLNDPKGGGQ